VDVANAAKTLPIGTKVLIGLLVAGFALHMSTGASFLVLVPNSTVGAHLYLWNLVTFALVEQGLLQLVASAVCVGMVGRVAEPLWGTTEFVKFLVIVNLFAGVILWLNAFILFQGSGDEKHLLVQKSGFQAGVGALLVAAKQLCGEQELGPIRAKHLASVYFLGCAVVSLFFSATFGTLGMIGTWFGWAYLRFYQTNGDRLGDMANSFGFVTFFPDQVHDAVAVPATIMYNLAAMCKLITKVEPPSDDDEDTFYTQQASTLGTNSAIAERRRLKAQKELEARLAAAGTGDDDDMSFADLDEEQPLDLESAAAAAEAVIEAIVGDAPKES